MKVRTIAVTLALCLAAVPVSFAQDAFMGVWKLKEARSEFSAGAPKNRTVVYEVEGDKVKVTVDSVSSDGKSTHNEWTGEAWEKGLHGLRNQAISLIEGV